MPIATDTWVWYDPAVVFPMAGSDSAGFQSAVLASSIPLGNIVDDARWIDVNQDGRIDDTDTLGAGDSFTPPAGEGLELNGTLHQLSSFAIFRVTVTTTEGQVITNLPLAAYQLADGTVALRLDDVGVQTLLAQGITLNEIASTDITSISSYFRSVGPAGHDDDFPCFARGTRIATGGALLAVKHLLGLPGFDVLEDAPGVEYFNLMLFSHEVILAEGAATESLYAGPEVLKALPRAARDETLGLFPELVDSPPVPARPLLTGRDASDGVAPGSGPVEWLTIRENDNAKSLISLTLTSLSTVDILTPALPRV